MGNKIASPTLYQKANVEELVIVILL